jgi:aminoglycoside/choline kinase family phosphotransferase
MDDLRRYIEDIVKYKLRWSDNCESMSIIPLTSGGSERNFYRINLKGRKSLVYMKYSSEKEENRYWYDIELFFKKLEINVPDIYFVEEGSIFLEDLGIVHLYDLIRDCSRDVLLRYYFGVLDQLIKLHQNGMILYEKNPFKISNGFNYNLYRWESNYFKENLIGNYFNMEVNESQDRSLEKDFVFLAETLSKERNILIHRDCQSKNIMIKDNSPYFIDFQGMRAGLSQYDLASLIEDPYAELSEEIKTQLLDYYAERNGICGDARERCKRIYRYCAVQRLLQATGAYAFLGIKKGKEDFFKYIPTGIRNLKSVLGNCAELLGICELVNRIPVV